MDVSGHVVGGYVKKGSTWDWVLWNSMKEDVVFWDEMANANINAACREEFLDEEKRVSSKVPFVESGEY